MLKKIVECGGAISMFVLAACGGNFQDVGDGSSGSGGAQVLGGNTAQGGSSANGASSSLNGSTSTSEGRGGAAWAPGTCDPPCSKGYGCYAIVDDPAGFCAPLCDSEFQGQTLEEDLSCSNSVRGGAGTCVFSLGFGWPFPGSDVNPSVTDNTVTGLCSNACDPIEQDCPGGYKCDFTSVYSAIAEAQVGLYACLPIKDSTGLGGSCDSMGAGTHCDAGLTCSTPNDQTPIREATCEALCDKRDDDACPAGRTCADTVITTYGNDPNIGVCL